MDAGAPEQGRAKRSAKKKSGGTGKIVPPEATGREEK
jgi:hypothetical protein